MILFLLFSNKIDIVEKIESIQKYLVDTNNKFGHQLTSKLGEGYNGVVYLTDKGYVIKNTSDKAEVKTALNIAKSINGQATPKYFDIHKNDDGSYIIVMEKINSISNLSGNEQKFLNMFSAKLISQLESGKDISIFKDGIKGKVGSPKFENILNGLIDCLTTLKSIGIINADIHEDNLGMVGNRLVMLDVVDEKYLTSKV